MSEVTADYDTPWKGVLEGYFERFLAFFFPQAHAGIDWNRGHEFLDKELQQVTQDAALGRRLVDKLVKVWRRAEGGEDLGAEAWVLVHVEVQGEAQADFAERMYVYNYRLFDRYHVPVASLAVLGDERASWRPERFGYELFGCEVGIRFPVAKLLDYRARWAELEASANPFAVAVMAHLKTQETRQDDEARRRWKLDLVRGLYERGYGRKEVIDWFRFVDWLMHLPEELEARFWQDVRDHEETGKVTYVTTGERIGYRRGLEEGEARGEARGRAEGRAEGRRDGLLAGIELGLELRFGVEGLRLLPEIGKLTDVETLRTIHEGIKVAGSPDELRAIYQQR